MASITIMNGHKNLLFAAQVANETGATFEENGQWITIEDTPELTIPAYAFRQAFDPDGRENQGRLDSAWRSLLLNKRGYLVHFDDSEIVIADEKPQAKRPAFLLRFLDEESKERAQDWADKIGYDSLTAFVLKAITSYCDFWEAQAKNSDEVS